MAYETTQVVKIKLKAAQKPKVEQAYGNVRYAYNFALSVWDAAYDEWCADSTKPKPNISYSDIDSWWTLNRPDFTKLSCRASQTRAFKNAERAYMLFFDSQHRPEGQKKNKHPKLHKKGVHESCYFTNYKVQIKGKYIQIPLIGWVEMSEPIKINGKLQNFVLKRHHGEDYIHFHFVCEDYRPKGTPRPGSVVAVDVGLKTPATAVNDLGEVFTLHMPDTVKALTRRIKHEQRILSRRHKGSKRWRRQKKKIQRLYQRKHNIKKDATNKFTSSLTKSHETVITETIRCTNMLKAGNKALKRAMTESCMCDIIKQLDYKAHRHESVQEYDPSSKRCSSCGHIKTSLSLNDRIYICDNCGFTLDRDENAARNLLHSGVGSPSVLVESIATP